MPGGIRKAPESTDPRDWHWLVRGFAWGFVPALKWRIKTTGAGAGLEHFNNGTIPPLYGWNEYYANYEYSGTVPPLALISLFIYTEADPLPGPTGNYTVSVFLQGRFTGWPMMVAAGYFLYPTKDQMFSLNATDLGGSPHTGFPNPITIEPRPWFDTDTPP